MASFKHDYTPEHWLSNKGLQPTDYNVCFSVARAFGSG
jgi:hypothetical protein